MARTALIVSYNGQPYHGWQYQGESVATVQRELTSAVSAVADASVTLHCAGRTDTGVHATKQVVHFDAPVSRPAKAWTLGVNAHLPADISVDWAGEVPADFDARRTATARHYCYVIHNVRIRSAIMSGFLTREPRQLDEALMHEAAQHLLGENDFSSFRASNCQSVSPMRFVSSVTVRRQGDLVIIDIVANAFLHHMVRNIAGVLMDVGAGLHAPDWVSELLALRDRTRGSVTAAPGGLFLVDVLYPDSADIPAGARFPHFLQSVALSAE